MRNEEFFCESEEGLYLIVGRNKYKPTKDYELFTDPTPEYDMAFDDYAKMDGYDEPVSILLLRVVNDEITLTDETHKFRDRLEKMFEDEDLREFNIPPAVNLPKPLLVHIARWPDGDYGCIGRSSEDVPDKILRQVDEWMGHYDQLPGNEGVTGMVLRLTQNGTDWTAERVCDAPAAPAPAEEMRP